MNKGRWWNSGTNGRLAVHRARQVRDDGRSRAEEKQVDDMPVTL